MRDIVFSLFITLALLTTLRSPFVGLMVWLLISLMAPHQEIYHLYTVPWNMIVAIVTIGAWLLSSERKLPPQGLTTILVLALLGWTTLNTFFAFDPTYSWLFWGRAWKIVAMAMLASILTTSTVRFHAVMWVVVLSLGYYGIKGGIFTLASGGHFHVFGPPATMIADNNSLAGALLMILPIMNYLRTNTDVRIIRVGIVAAMIFVVIGIIGSYSRGAYIGFAALACAYWLRSKNKIVFPVIALLVMLPLLHFMPDSFFTRASSIEDYNSDISVMSRFDSWWVAYRYAMDHLPFGTGFYGMTLQGVWDQYIPRRALAAHSIYFQVLGEQGVIGLVLYLLTIVSGFLNLRAVIRDTKGLSRWTSTRELAEMMRLSLFSFCVCGAALPIDFYDLFFLWMMLSASLREMTRKEKAVPVVHGGLLRELTPLPRLIGVPPV